MKKINNEFEQLDKILAEYQPEELPPQLAAAALERAISSTAATTIVTIKPAWKRLSLAASVAAFALGLVMSNPVFASDKDSDYESWNFGDMGLYSFVLEGE